MRKLLLVVLLLVFSTVPALGMEATASAEATPAGTLSIEAVTKQDITERTSEVKGKLEGYLDQKEIGKLSWHNWLQQAIRQAVAKGVSANTIVLVLLFPLVAGMIAAARHLLGLTGFGIFVPAMLSVAFVAIGIKAGLVMLVVIFMGAALARKTTEKLKLQYLPRMALMMWLVSVVVLGVLLGAVNVNLGGLSAVSIFPILILMLLTENFIEVQTGKSRHEAVQVMLQTMAMAVVGALILRNSWVQKLALLNPELFLLIVAALDIYVGKYVGLRVMEMWKFRKLIK
ncbi:MAG: 7TM domain-containing protein [Candidatus Beckwithbacteria bacterium]